MSYCEDDLASLLLDHLDTDGHITHLYELDPTHIAAQTGCRSVADADLSIQSLPASLASCMLAEFAAAPVLLELDPTRLHVR